MKRLAIIHISLTVLLLIIIGVSLKLPSDLYYKPWFTNLFWVAMFCELIVFPSIYIYKEYEKRIYGIIAFIVFSILMIVLIFFPLFLCSKSFHMVNVTERDNEYYYSYEDYFNDSCPHKVKYKSVNILFYKKISEDRDCG